MPEEKQGGPIEVRLRASTREEIRALCDCSNQELLAIMEQEIERPGEEFDEELFDAAQSLLDERAPIGESVDGETACREFVEAHANLLQQKGGDQDRPTGEKHRRSFRQIVRTTVIAAALVIGIFCFGAVATGQDPLVIISDAGETLIRNVAWGPSGTLELPQTDDNYASLEDALLDCGAEDAAVITWIPSRFTLNMVAVQPVPNSEGRNDFRLWAHYSAEEEEFVYGVSSLPHIEGRSYVEKNIEEKADILVVRGVEYEVVNNYGLKQVYWITDDYSYVLTGNLSENEIRKILTSLR